MKPTLFRATAARSSSGWRSMFLFRLDATGATSDELVDGNQVLEWNQIFIDTLIATNTPNSSSQRLGAIVHTAIFDAYNGIERRFAPIFVHNSAPPGASRRAAVIAAAYTALVSLFPSRQAALDASYDASLAALSDDGERRRARSRERGLDWGIEVANRCLPGARPMGSARATPRSRAGTAVGQWRPTPPAFGPMSAKGLAFTDMFVLVNNTQFQPDPPRSLTEQRLRGGFQCGQSARPKDRLDADRRPDGTRAVLGRQRQRPLESGGEPDRAQQSPVNVHAATDCSPF